MFRLIVSRDGVWRVIGDSIMDVVVALKVVRVLDAVCLTLNLNHRVVQVVLSAAQIRDLAE